MFGYRRNTNFSFRPCKYGAKFDGSALATRHSHAVTRLENDLFQFVRAGMILRVPSAAVLVLPLTTNEIDVRTSRHAFHSSASKACFISASVFLLEHLNLIQFDHELIYLCVASMFIYVRIITLFFKQYDPLMPFENLLSGLLFNSWSEILVRTSLAFRLSHFSKIEFCSLPSRFSLMPIDEQLQLHRLRSPPTRQHNNNNNSKRRS